MRAGQLAGQGRRIGGMWALLLTLPGCAEPVTDERSTALPTPLEADAGPLLTTQPRDVRSTPDAEPAAPVERDTEGTPEPAADAAALVDLLPVQDASVEVSLPDPVTPELPDWVQGVWQRCGGTLTIGPSAYTWRGTTGCKADGPVTWDGQFLGLLPEVVQDCSVTPAILQPDLGATVQGELLTLLHPKLANSIQKFAKYGGLRERWLVTVEGGQQSWLYLCYDKTGTFYEGSHQGIESCQFFSCGGQVTGVKAKGGETHIWTACEGGCPCGGVAIAASKTDSAMSGKLFAANCQQGYTKTFTAERKVWPDDPN